MVTRSQITRLGNQIQELAVQLGVTDEAPPPFDCPAIFMSDR
jgi:hypothetical protein